MTKLIFFRVSAKLNPEESSPSMRLHLLNKLRKTIGEEPNEVYFAETRKDEMKVIVTFEVRAVFDFLPAIGEESIVIQREAIITRLANADRRIDSVKIIREETLGRKGQ